ncbi:MAG: DUF1579 domain-containing protein [Rhodoferax sp.]|nr:DUF1579 domain-containing protein [Rhodoferax sp.]
MTPTRHATGKLGLAALLAWQATSSWAQTPETPAALMSQQREAMTQLSYMDGAWRGSAWTLDRSGNRQEVTQTERIGSLLNGTVRVIEGRGYTADGTAGFQALGVVSYDVATKKWSMRSWAQGRSGDFPFVPTTDGFTWTTPAGPNATVRYTAVIKGDVWREVGEYLATGREPRQIFEMNLRRIATTKWPEEGAIPMQ